MARSEPLGPALYVEVQLARKGINNRIGMVVLIRCFGILSLHSPQVTYADRISHGGDFHYLGSPISSSIAVASPAKASALRVSMALSSRELGLFSSLSGPLHSVACFELIRSVTLFQILGLRTRACGRSRLRLALRLL